MLKHIGIVLLVSIIKSIYSSIIHKSSSYLPQINVSLLTGARFCMKSGTRIIMGYEDQKIEYFDNPLSSIQEGITIAADTVSPLAPSQCLNGREIFYMNAWLEIGIGTFTGTWSYKSLSLFGITCDMSSAELIPNSLGVVLFPCFNFQILNFVAYDAALDMFNVLMTVDITAYKDEVMNFIDCDESIIIDGYVCIYGLDTNVYIHFYSYQGPNHRHALQNIDTFAEGRIVQIDSSLFIVYWDLYGLHCYHGRIALDTPAIAPSSVITLELVFPIQHNALAQCIKKQNKLWLKQIDYTLIFGCINIDNFSIFILNKNDLSIQKIEIPGVTNGDVKFLYSDSYALREITLAWIEASPIISVYVLNIPYCVNATYSTNASGNIPFTVSSIFPALDNYILSFKLKTGLLFGSLVFQSSNSELVVDQYNLIDPLNENVLYTPRTNGIELITLTGITLENMELSCSIAIAISTTVTCPQYTIPQGSICINCKDTGEYYYNSTCLISKPSNTFYVDTNFNAIDYCYPLCQTCNSKGTLNDHQCTSCINGYALDPISSTQCILTTACSEYYYYDSNGIKQCTSTCSVAPYLFLLYSCKQCLDNCNSPEACESCQNSRYTYSNYCLDKCPMGTKPINTTLTCEASVNEDYLIYSPKDIIDWINSVTKEDLIQFAKNDSIIINENYIIDIYNTTNGNSNSSSTIIADSLNISRLSLPECAKRLKEHYNIPESDPLVILKIDLDNNQLITNQVEYEIYSLDGRKLDLSICENSSVIIESHIKTDERIQWELAVNLSLKGIDIFDTSDRFYNDFCFPYSTNASTDILIEDRRSDIYPNISLCQLNCTYKSVNYTAMTVECDCNASTSFDNTLKTPSLKDKFLDSFVSSNIEVVTCSKLVFDWECLKGNIAFWLFLAFIIIQLIFGLVYAFHDYSSLKKDINGRRIIRRDTQRPAAPPVKHSLNTKNSTNSNLNLNNKTRHSIETTQSDVTSGNKFLQSKSIATTENNDMSPNRLGLYRKSLVNLDSLNKMSLMHSPETIKKTDYNNDVLTLNSSDLSNAKRKGFSRRLSSIIIQQIPMEKEEKTQLEKIEEERRARMITYEDSLKYDNRRFHRMFWDILIEKDIIFDTIFKFERFQKISIKATNCIISIALDFSFNALFYSVDIISNSYENEGMLDMVFSLPKTLYSALASMLLLWILSFFSATNWTFRTFKMKRRYVQKFLRCILIKHIIFFSLNFIFMIFCWYYTVAFCSVYYNSQIEWLIDSSVSTLMGICLSIGISLSLSLLRMISLKHHRKCLFEVCRIGESL